MKKRFIFLASMCILCLDSSVNAQDTIKAIQGSFLTELNINPLQGSINLNNSINQIKFRYFVREDVALRIAFGFNSNSQNSTEVLKYGNNPIDNSIEKKYSIFSTGFGFEKHLKGTRRLSPYVGAELAFAYKNTESSFNSINSSKTVKGAWLDMTYVQTGNNGNYYSIVTNYSEKGFTSFGINALAGFDYYISNHLFLGYELIFVINKKWYQKLEISETFKGSDYGTSNSYPDTDADEFEFGPKIINGVRLGFIF